MENVLVPTQYQYDPWWVPDRGHNDVLQHNEKEFLKKLRGFRDHVTEKLKGGSEDAAATTAGAKNKGSYALVAGESKMDSVVINSAV